MFVAESKNKNQYITVGTESLVTWVFQFHSYREHLCKGSDCSVLATVKLWESISVKITHQFSRVTQLYARNFPTRSKSVKTLLLPFSSFGFIHCSAYSEIRLHYHCKHVANINISLIQLLILLTQTNHNFCILTTQKDQC